MAEIRDFRLTLIHVRPSQIKKSTQKARNFLKSRNGENQNYLRYTIK